MNERGSGVGFIQREALVSDLSITVGLLMTDYPSIPVLLILSAFING
jgi:hypothetical protein